MNVFDCAIKIEEEARKFYERMELESATTELKNLFAILASAENEHLQALMDLKRSDDYQTGEVEDLNNGACAFRAAAQVCGTVAGQNSDRDFYLHAIREEEQDIKFYEDLAARAKDEKLRSKLLMIAAEERQHLERIENIYDFVEAPRTFLAWGEFTNLSEL